ncbi:hypothetical protein A5881_002411 [Enterococcus termitis]|nr:hypothetical protein A5881_001269 [Enterococcus termitis]
MKERVVVFGDAIIAIILTIMVLELPIQYAVSGEFSLSRTCHLFYVKCTTYNFTFFIK